MRNYFLRKDAITVDVAKKRLLDKHGESIKLLNFAGAHHKSEFECQKCGNIWSADASSVWRGNGCSVCMIQRLREANGFNFEFVRSFIESEKCELLSKEYVNSKTRIKIRFECGHIKNVTFDSFRSGKRCPCQSPEKANKIKSSKTEKLILGEIKNSGFELVELLSNKFSWNAKLKLKCPDGHITQTSMKTFMRRKSCKECSRIRMSLAQIGSKGNNWQGGKRELSDYFDNKIIQWKKDSMKNCNYKCQITGENFDDIHHLQSFNSIIKEAVDFFAVSYSCFSGDCSDEILEKLTTKVIELHYKYPLGVCLTRKVHKLFHNIYGKGNNTPEQFYEFQQKIQNKEILI